MDDSGSVEFLEFCFSKRQRDRFLAGELGPQWAARYPELFDDDDRRIHDNQHDRGYHFYEWLGAILLYEATGYLSLVEKYWATSHPRKIRIYESLVSKDVYEMDGVGWPDLVCYTADQKDWFFCEVKGAADILGVEQLRRFQMLHEATGKPVRVLRLSELGR